MNKEQFNYDNTVQMYNRMTDIKKIEAYIAKLQINPKLYKKRIQHLQSLKSTLMQRNKSLHILTNLDADEPPKLQTTPRSDPRLF